MAKKKRKIVKRESRKKSNKVTKRKPVKKKRQISRSKTVKTVKKRVLRKKHISRTKTVKAIKKSVQKKGTAVKRHVFKKGKSKPNIKKLKNLPNTKKEESKSKEEILNEKELKRNDKLIKEKIQKLQERKNEKEKALQKSVNSSKFRLSERKLNHLINIGKLEEFYFMIGLMDEAQVQVFIDHYKNRKHQVKEPNQKIHAMIMAATRADELFQSLKKELSGQLTSDYQDLLSDISQQRKKGQNMDIIFFKTMNVPAKIKLFEATFEKKDYYVVKKMIQDIKEIIKKDENDKNKANLGSLKILEKGE